MDVTEYINHVRNHSYMSGIERDALRIKHTAEVFTPFLLVNQRPAPDYRPIGKSKFEKPFDQTHL